MPRRRARPTAQGTARERSSGAALLLQSLADVPDATLSSRVGRLPSYRIVKEKMAFPRDLLGEDYLALEHQLPAGERDDGDGLRLKWRHDASWLHVRPSGTEPVVRLIAEAPASSAARGLVGRARRTLAAVANDPVRG